MADDLFGDESLFSEFERDRETENIFIQYEKDEFGSENRSRIVFTAPESDSDDSDDSNETDTRNSKTETGSEQKGNEPETAGLQRSDGGNEGIQRAEEAAYVDVDAFGKEQNGAQTTSYQEHFEKNKLRKFARLIDSTRCAEEDCSPGVQILFQNNRFAKKYRARIEQFIMSLTQDSAKKDFGKTFTDLSSQGAVTTCVDLNDRLPMEKRNEHMWQVHGIVGCVQFHSQFMVDSRGWPYDPGAPSAEVPKYVQVFEEVFPVDEAIAAPQKPAKQSQSCFNCGGDHRLNECQIPKNHNRIRAKRQEFREKAGNKQSGASRYHLDPELDPQKPKFQAGVLSNGLREAMGLQGDQLPPFIYRMRLFGYPPGWLMEANRKASSMAMYDKDGRETNMRGESLEDGECGDQNASNDPAELFDVSKIIEYPGFTVPLPEGFVDESHKMGMPPIQQHQLKKTLMEDVSTKEKAKKRQLEVVEAEKNKKLKTSTEDMDVVEIDDDDEVIAEPVKTSSPADDGEKRRQDRENGGSPSMDALQQEYKNLVQQLDSEPNGNASATTSGVEEMSDTSSAQPSDRSVAEKSLSDAEMLREKNFSFTSSSSISKDYGTPILVRDKSFKVLPSPDKFRVGTEEHIPFENLPDSVGTFEKMKNLFSIIKSKVKKIKK